MNSTTGGAVSSPSRREYHAVPVALDLLDVATEGEIHGLTQARGWDDLAGSDRNAAAWNLDATYLIRMYSIFERAAGSFWRQIPGNEGRQDNGNLVLDEVGNAQLIDSRAVAAAQEVRIHRNDLVHRKIEGHAIAMPIEAASRDLLTYLDRLPSTWG